MTSRSEIPAPALRGDDPLGYLAAVGVLALSHVGVISELRLGWSSGLTPHAVFDSAAPGDVGGLRSELEAVVGTLRKSPSPGVLPGAPPDVPLVKKGTGTDPNRMGREEARRLFERAADDWIQTEDRWFGRWLAGLYSQVAADDRGRVRLTPLYGPFGQMSLRLSLYESTYAAMERVDGPGDALTGWVRCGPRQDYDGANLDSRAKRGGAVTTDGKSANQGVPSPTWLATMSPVLMPIADVQPTGGSTMAVAVGWQAVRLRRDLTARSLVWPIWDGYLDGHAFQAMVSHPALRVSGRDESASLGSGQLAGLGIRAVYGSSRSIQSQGDGPLAPARRLWPTS
jgi:CRISPR-associated endonuclease/helicase Cas3